MLTDVLSDYIADITAIQELRWVGSGVMQKRDYDLYYSCHYSKHIFGTGFVVNKRIHHMVIGFEPLGMRKCWDLMTVKSEMNGMAVNVQNSQKKNMMPTKRCCKNTEQEHQLKYIRHEEGKRNILSRRKRGSMRKRCEEVEELHPAKEIRQFYQNTNSIQKRFKPNSLLCKDKQGNIIAETADTLERWEQHFEEVLNPNNVHLENHIHPSEVFEESVKLDRDEMDIALAIKELKNYKALGPDGLPTELFKYGGDILNKYLYKLISEILTKEEMPVDWKVGLVCPTYKKGNPLECKNDRGYNAGKCGIQDFLKDPFQETRANC
jgi:hypothetical protein